jgi:hypothetical protein
MGNFKRLGNFEDQNGEKKRLIWLGKQPIFGLYKEGFFGPVRRRLFEVNALNHSSMVQFQLKLA